MQKSIFFFLFVVLISNLFAQGIVINEICSQGSATIRDFSGEHSDWIELYNAGADSVDCSKIYLSDNKTNPLKYQLQQKIIAPNSYLLVYASGKDTVVKNEIHTNFKIDGKGEQLFITNIQNNSSNSIQVPLLHFGESWGRSDVSAQGFVIFDLPTPLSDNSKSSNIYFSNQGGLYKNIFSLFLRSDQNDEIHYTTNGKEPNISSPLFTDSLPITLKKLNLLSSIPTTPLSGKDYIDDFMWKQPQIERNTGTVIKCRSYRNGTPTSKIYTQSYILDSEIDELLEFPVISIVTDSLNLFNYETGIFLPGSTFDNTEWSGYWPPGNYHRSLQKPANIEFYEPNGMLVCNAPAKMEIKGGGSACLPQKSLKIRFYPDNGFDKLDYKLFPSQSLETYKSFVLRNGGNDFVHTHFLDAFLHNLINDIGIETLAFRPCHAYINGEYWGVFDIRETYDKSYFKYHFGVNEDDLIIVNHCGNPEYGSNSGYLSLIEFMENNAVSEKQNYEYVCSKIDIQNCIDYYISEIYFANYDWPGNNYAMWKTTDSLSKWRWAIYDLDFSWAFDSRMHYTKNSFLHATKTGGGSWPAPDCSTYLFRTLLTNDEFKTQFINRFVYHLQNTFSTDRVLSQIDSFKNMYINQIDHQIARWGYPQDYTAWEDNVEKLRDFAKYRPCYISQYMKDYFSLSSVDFECEFTGIDIPNAMDSPSIEYENNLIVVKSPEEIQSVSVFNILGQKIYCQQTQDDSYQSSISIDNNVSRIIIVSVITENGIYSEKVFIE